MGSMRSNRLATDRTSVHKPDHADPLHVVITGASSGIGQATPELFARRDAKDRAEPVELAEGNLFEPSTDAALVEGGLRNPRKRAAAGGIAGLGAALGLLVFKRGNSAQRP